MLIQSGTDHVDVPITSGYLNSLRIPVCVVFAPVGADEVNAAEDNLFILVVEDLSTLSMKRVNHGGGNLALGKIIFYE